MSDNEPIPTEPQPTVTGTGGIGTVGNVTLFNSMATLSQNQQQFVNQTMPGQSYPIASYGVGSGLIPTPNPIAGYYPYGGMPMSMYPPWATHPFFMSLPYGGGPRPVIPTTTLPAPSLGMGLGGQSMGAMYGGHLGMPPPVLPSQPQGVGLKVEGEVHGSSSGPTEPGGPETIRNGAGDEMSVADLRNICQDMRNLYSRFRFGRDQLPPAGQAVVDELVATIREIECGYQNSANILATPGDHRISRDRERSDSSDGDSTDVDSQQIPSTAAAGRGVVSQSSNVHTSARASTASSIPSPNIGGNQMGASAYTRNLLSGSAMGSTGVANTSGVTNNLGNTVHSPITHPDLSMLLSRLDRRRVPEPEVFDLSSGRSLDSFLQQFEEYCKSTFVGSTQLWARELVKYLTGEAKMAVEAMSGDKEYHELRAELLQWVDKRKELLARTNKDKFKGATLHDGESYSLYAARLVKLFRIAYPKRSVERSETLKTKFVDSMPATLRHEILLTQNMAFSYSGKAMTWDQLVAFVGQSELNQQKQSASETQTIWVARTENSGESGPGDQTTNYRMPSSVATRTSRPERPAQPTSHSLPPQTQQPNMNRQAQRPEGNCYHCGNEGHHIKNCWRRLGVCLVCGAADHKVAECPSRQGIRAASRSYRTPRVVTGANEEPVGTRPLNQ